MVGYTWANGGREAGRLKKTDTDAHHCFFFLFADIETDTAGHIKALAATAKPG